VIAAVLFGAMLYSTAQIGRSLPIGWAVLAPRVTGAALVAMPLAIRRRLVLTWRAAPLVVVAGVAEVIGFACIGLGSRSDVAITAVPPRSSPSSRSSARCWCLASGWGGTNGTA